MSRTAIYLLIFIIVTSACATAGTATPTPLPPATSAPTAASTVAPSEMPASTATSKSVKPSACVPANTKTQKGKVARVVDGDTIVVSIGSKNYKVRYIGIDTPEVNPEVEPYGKAASARNKELVAGKTVTLIKDVSDVDQYDRLLRYVFVGNTFVNYVLVEEGFAQAFTFPPDVACADTFKAAQEEAREQQRGLWGSTSAP